MAEKYDELWDVEWSLIPGQKYIMKYKFQDSGYTLLVTNFSEIYGEKLTSLDLLARFSDTNPFVQMKPAIIRFKIRHALESNLSSTNNEMKMVSFDKHLLFELEFTVNEVSFFFDLKPQLLSAEKLRTHVIAPTVLTSFLSFQENNILNKKREDSENKISSAQKSTIDPRTNVVLSTLSKKSKIDIKDVLESFVQSQKSMIKYINDSKNHIDQTKSSEVRKTEVLLPNKRELNSEEGNSSNIKYEDKPYTSTIKEEDSTDFNSKDSTDLLITSSLLQSRQTNPKLKKKKTFNI